MIGGLFALLLQFFVLGHSWNENPFTRLPVDDAEVNWNLAAVLWSDLAPEEPFLTAPLNLVFLALVQTLGLGLRFAFIVQTLAWACTGVLLAGLVRRLFADFVSPPAAGRWGLLTLGAWTLLAPDAGLATGRLLGGCLQLLLVVLVWQRHLAWQSKPTLKNVSLSGALLGLLCLAAPPFVLAIPILVVLVWQRSKAPQAGLVLVACLAILAPATAHNYKKTGEWILISAQAGVTFHHGNAPGAEGTYQTIPGVSASRMMQNVDARQLAKEAGYPSWKGASRYWFLQGLAWWQHEPIAAITTAGRKALLFFGETEYGDTDHPGLERKFLSVPSLGWGWLSAAFYLPGLAGLLLLIRRKSADPFAAVLFLIPLCTVILFFYSPRYRLPALPLALVGSLALLALPAARRWASALLPAGLLLSLISWQNPASLEPTFLHKLGSLYEKDGNHWEKAESCWRQAHDAGLADAGVSLGLFLRRTGRGQEGFALLQDAVQARPQDAFARRALGVAFAESMQPKDAEREFRAALALDPDHWETLSGLGGSCLEQKRIPEAKAFFQRAIAARPSFASAWFNLGLAEALAGDFEAAVSALRTALRLAPQNVAIQRELGALEDAKAKALAPQDS